MDKLGIQPIQLLLQAFNFLLMVILLSKFLYNPILRALNERKKKIAEGLAYTEKMKQEEEKTEKKRQEILASAKEEAKKIIEESKKAGKKLEEDILEKARLEGTSIVEKGKKDIGVEREELEIKLRGKTVEVAQAMVEQILTEILTEKNQKVLINKKLNQLVKHLK